MLDPSLICNRSLYFILLILRIHKGFFLDSILSSLIKLKGKYLKCNLRVFLIPLCPFYNTTRILCIIRNENILKIQRANEEMYSTYQIELTKDSTLLLNIKKAIPMSTEMHRAEKKIPK